MASGRFFTSSDRLLLWIWYRRGISDHHRAEYAAARFRASRRLVPEIAKAFRFRVTRIERYIVACYDAAGGGHFCAHRDNTTKGTRHRRFAVTVNLYDGCDGGELWFPEVGRQYPLKRRRT